jgi:hypothetical protein
MEPLPVRSSAEYRGSWQGATPLRGYCDSRCPGRTLSLAVFAGMYATLCLPCALVSADVSHAGTAAKPVCQVYPCELPIFRHPVPAPQRPVLRVLQGDLGKWVGANGFGWCILGAVAPPCAVCW